LRWRVFGLRTKVLIGDRDRSQHSHPKRRGQLVRVQRTCSYAQASHEMVRVTTRIGDDLPIRNRDCRGWLAVEVANQRRPLKRVTAIELGQPGQAHGVIVGSETDEVGVCGEHGGLLSRMQTDGVGTTVRDATQLRGSCHDAS
jgi:hypothetical protein